MLEGLDSDDLEQQVALIEGSLYAHLARESTAFRPVPEEKEEDYLVVPSSDEAFVAPALDLAESIRSRAILTEDGSAAWIAPSTWSRQSATNYSPSTTTSTAGRAASRCFSGRRAIRPGAGYGELARAALVRAKHDGPPSR